MLWKINTSVITKIVNTTNILILSDFILSKSKRRHKNISVIIKNINVK